MDAVLLVMKELLANPIVSTELLEHVHQADNVTKGVKNPSIGTSNKASRKRKQLTTPSIGKAKKNPKKSNEI